MLIFFKDKSLGDIGMDSCPVTQVTQTFLTEAKFKYSKNNTNEQHHFYALVACHGQCRMQSPQKCYCHTQTVTVQGVSMNLV